VLRKPCLRPLGKEKGERGCFACFQVDRSAYFFIFRCPLRRRSHRSGGVPEWLKGTDCKSVGFAYVGSNPTPSTKTPREDSSVERESAGDEGEVVTSGNAREFDFPRV
jgi:hypothetical protein